MIDAKTRQKWLTIRPEGSAADRGFTLLEVLVTIAILGVIVVPLAQTLIAGFKVTAEVQDNVNASVNRDQLASRFTNDVAEVDAAGYSTGANSCTTSTAVSTDKLILTLNSSKLNTSGTRVVKRVSYWTTGSGRQLSIARRQCNSVTPGQPQSNGTETIVAADIGGDEFATRANTIYENIATSSGGVTFCDEYRCSMQIASVAPRSTTITAQRRVFGAGVPLQVGRLYSSSKSDNASTGVAYDTFNAAGVAQGTERTFPNLLSLPPGLDGSDSLSVYFEVKQVSTGKWLANDRSGFTKTQNEKNAQGDDLQVPADPPSPTNGSAWTVPLTVGAGKVASAGGEYQVYTSLKETGQPAKKYGGASGFPLWIDWKPLDSVFVNASAPGCTTNDGLTKDTPVCTPAQGLTIATTPATARPNILINNNGGTAYSGDLQITNAVANNRAVVGGFDGNWLRLAPNATNGQTKITGTAGTGILVNARTNIRLRQLDVNSGPNTGTLGSSTYGLRAIASSTVFAERSTFSSQQGANGADATAAAPAAAANGGPSKDAGDAYCDGFLCTSFHGGAGGGATTNTGRVQGAAGGNGKAGNNAGDYGSTSNANAAGGRGGCGSAFGTCGEASEGGRSAAATGGGSPGASPNITPAGSSGSTFVASDGVAGAVGVDGGGGGGGGGGSSTLASAAGGGGSGGEGGRGGAAGTTGGKGGGGSFGIYINNSVVTMDTITVTAGKGGTGGKGSPGGPGGAGSQGGRGGGKWCCEATGGSGGGGGGGGSGGAGASGGPGGPSVSVMLLGTASTVTPSGVTNTINLPAAGGDTGPGGNGGPGGNLGLGGNVVSTPANFIEGWFSTNGDCALIGNKCAQPGQNGYKGQTGVTGRANTPGMRYKTWSLTAGGTT